MALTHSSSATLFLLLSLSVIAAAGGYSYDQKPDTTKPDHTYNSKSKPDLHKPYYDSNPKPTLPKPKFTEPKPDKGYDSKPYLGQPTTPKPDTAKPNYGYNPKPEVPKPKLTMPKPNYGNDPKPKLIVPKPDTAKPNYGYKPKPEVPKPKMTVPKPDHGYDPKGKVYEQPKSTAPKPEIIKPHDGYAQKPNLPEPKLYIPKPSNDKLDYEYSPIGIEGFVLCKRGSNYTPIEGAVIRIACTAVDQYGYKKVPFSCLTEATNAKGYYFKTLPALKLTESLKLTECKAYLESSPLKTCNVPTDMNYGITGAPLSAYHVLHDKKIKLYSMRTFFYTSTKPTSAPAGY
ncbi:proline-rich protein 3-like [Populus alba x Populus x berolinensis]|nr:proline-rich protein 3-like [Populus alba x Populus x berolinensis]